MRKTLPMTAHLSELLRRLPTPAVLCLAAACALTACGGGSSDSPPDTETPTTPTQPGEPSTPAPQMRCAP